MCSCVFAAAELGIQAPECYLQDCDRLDLNTGPMQGRMRDEDEADEQRFDSEAVEGLVRQ
jgi:hypothetical protein